MTSLSPPYRALALPVPFPPGLPKGFPGPARGVAPALPSPHGGLRAGSGGAAGSIPQPALLLRGAGCPWIAGAVGGSAERSRGSARRLTRGGRDAPFSEGRAEPGRALPSPGGARFACSPRGGSAGPLLGTATAAAAGTRVETAAVLPTEQL